METLNKSFNDFLSDKLSILDCDRDTRSYIVSILDSFKRSQFDYSKQSITLLYSEAKSRQDFLTFQRVGDWLFLCHSVFPEHLNQASSDYYLAVGQLSYDYCYRLLNKEWKLYQCLADNLPNLTKQTRNIIRSL
jgi:hypothetical protein